MCRAAFARNMWATHLPNPIHPTPAQPAILFPVMSLNDPVPQPVLHLDANAIEWPALLALLAASAASQPGREAIYALHPSLSQPWILLQHQLVAQLDLFLANASDLPSLAGLFDPTDLLANASIPDAALDAPDLVAIARLALQQANWREAIHTAPSALAARIPDLRELTQPLSGSLLALAESIQNKFLPDGTLHDHASPELARIRREQLRQHRLIQDSLRSALRRLSEEGHAQDELITVRGDRFVIPVKVEQKRRLSGVLHGASSSGQTVFLEPLETIEHNNELVRLLEEEQAEIHRIFVALTRLVAQHSHSLASGARILTLLDSLHARVRFARDFRAIRPTFSHHPDSDLFSLKDARHPLLEDRLRSTGAAIVPFSLALDRDHRQLILSGPNTGGKTVTLKTAALLAVMAQSGIPVPASAAQLPIFTAFLADIGDAQSIQQALSTFSAHITNITRLAALATQPDPSAALVLLDELGSATDPDEGSALAVAIADHFRLTPAWSIITTHHTSLKVYAANTPGVLNAAAGVDPDTLAPNYQLRLGVPGVSAGIATAERLGMSQEIVAGAKARLGSQQLDIARFLDAIHAQLLALEEDRKAARAEQYALNQERARLAREGDADLKNRSRALELEFASLIRDFESQMRQAIAAIDDKSVQLKLSKDSQRRIERLRAEFEGQFRSTVATLRSPSGPAGETPSAHDSAAPLSPGRQVHIKSLNKAATILRHVEKDLYEVTLGALKMRVKRNDIAAAVPDNPSSSPLLAVRRTSGVTVTAAHSDSIPSEINFIGFTVDQATQELEKYLDRAFLAGLPRLRVIHGTGMGVLRRALRDYLRTHPHVASIEEPSQLEGGAGATTVHLRQ